MSRIATLSASNRLLEVMTKVQGRLQDQQVRVTTEKASQDYAGIATKAGRLVSLETTRAAVGRAIDDNAIIETRLSAMDSALEAIGETMSDFRAMLLDLGSNKPLDEAHVGEVQAFAFRALKDMESYLNTEVNGRFLFAGSRATTRPVDLELTTMTDFQDRFDGESLIYPPTRAAHVGMTATLPPAVTGGLTISGGDRITAGTAGALANIPFGATIRLSGSGLGNDGEYTVVSNDGTAITIAGTLTAGTASMMVSGSINDGAEPGATLSVANWYAGDEVAASHRVEGERTLSLSLNGIDPAFEKAIRAMGIIAQGEYGTAGGLEQNLDRVDHALALLDSALERASGASEPLGPELAGSIETVRMDLGFDLAVVNETRERQKALAVNLDNQIGEIENVDPLEALTKLLDDGRALEASYQVVARIREFSLMNYL